MSSKREGPVPSRIQDSGYGDLFYGVACLAFDGVFEDESGAGVAGFGGGEVVAEFGDGDGVGFGVGGEWVQADGQVSGFGGVDVAGLVEGLAHEGVCFVGGFGVSGVGADLPCDRHGGVVGGHADAGVDEFGLGVQDLLARVQVSEPDFPGDLLVVCLGRVQGGFCLP